LFGVVVTLYTIMSLLEQCVFHGVDSLSLVRII